MIFLLGDSLTELSWHPGGISQRLSEAYARKLDVINRGFSGYNTRWAIPVFEQCFPKNVRLLIIWLGGNDTCLVPSPQHVPFAEYKENLDHLIELVKSPTSPLYSPSTAIVLITPPPVDTYKRAAQLGSRDPPIPVDRHFEVTKTYAEAVKALGSKQNIPVVDAWNIIYNAAGRDERKLQEFLPDGLHLSATAYSLIFDGLMDTIREHYPHTYHENIQPEFPLWKEIDWDNPIPSLKRKPIA